MANRTRLLLAAALSCFVTPFMISSVNVALPAIGAEFGLSAGVLAWVVTAYMISAAIFLIPVGRFADLKGRLLTFRGGILFFAVMSLAATMASSGTALIGIRFLQGLGGAMIFSTSTAIVTSAFPLGQRGRAMGFLVASVYAGLSFGPVAGGFMTEHWGWRSLFLIQVFLGIAIFALSLKVDRDSSEDRSVESFDLAGAILYAGSLALVLGGAPRLPSMTGIGLVIVGLVGLALFLDRARRVPNALIRLDHFRGNNIFIYSNLAALLHYGATTGVGLLLSLYLQTVKGMSPSDAGLLLVIQPAAMALLSPIAGRLSDRIEPRLLASLGMVFTTAAVAGLALLDATTPPALIGTALFALGFGFALFSSPNTNAVMSSAPAPLLGAASAVLGTMRMIGQSLSMALVMMTFALVLGDAKLEAVADAPFLRSMRITLAVFTAFCLAGLVASMARGRLHDEDR